MRSLENEYYLQSPQAVKLKYRNKGVFSGDFNLLANRGQEVLFSWSHLPGSGLQLRPPQTKGTGQAQTGPLRCLFSPAVLPQLAEDEDRDRQAFGGLCTCFLGIGMSSVHQDSQLSCQLSRAHVVAAILGGRQGRKQGVRVKFGLQDRMTSFSQVLMGPEVVSGDTVVSAPF